MSRGETAGLVGSPVLANPPTVTASTAFDLESLSHARSWAEEFVAGMPPSLHKTDIPVPVHTESAVELGSNPKCLT